MALSLVNGTDGKTILRKLELKMNASSSRLEVSTNVNVSPWKGYAKVGSADEILKLRVLFVGEVMSQTSVDAEPLAPAWLYV